jgi:hypothetical protein
MNLRKAAAPACVLLLLVTFYSLLNTRCSFDFNESTDFVSFNLFAESLLAGQISLKPEVHPERAKAPDSNNPNLPYPFLLDALIFQGKYYFLQEPLPVLPHLLALLTAGAPLPAGVVIVVTASLVLIGIALLLLRIRNTFFVNCPEWIVWYVAGLFAFSGPQLYMVSRPLVYHEAIAVGVLFTVFGTILLFENLFRSVQNYKFWVLSGIFLGAAVLCRATLVVYFVCHFSMLFIYSLLLREERKTILKRSIALALPFIGGVGLLLIYNYARFGNLLDFGRTYNVYPWQQIYEYVCVRNQAFRAAHVPRNLFVYLFSLPEISFDYWLPHLRYPHEIRAVGDTVMGREQLGSLLVVFPALIAGLPIGIISRWHAMEHRLKFLICDCFLTSAMMFFFLTLYFFAAARYLYEFTPLLMVIIFVNIAIIWEKFHGKSGIGRTSTFVLALFFMLNFVLGLSLALKGMMQLR